MEDQSLNSSIEIQIVNASTECMAVNGIFEAVFLLRGRVGELEFTFLLRNFCKKKTHVLEAL